MMKPSLSDDEIALLRRFAWCIDERRFALAILALVSFAICLSLIGILFYFRRVFTPAEAAWVISLGVVGVAAYIPLFRENRALMLRIGRLGGLDKLISHEMMGRAERPISFSVRGAKIRLGMFVLLTVLAAVLLKDGYAKLAACGECFLFGFCEVVRLARWPRFIAIIKKLERLQEDD